MKLEVGMYVRTKDGTIDKIIDVDTDWYELDADEKEKPYKVYQLSQYYYDEEFNEETDWFLERFFVKASHNIIDLIEVGDYVNGIEINLKDEKGVYHGAYDCYDEYHFTDPKEIKSIVTKEQFEQMQYKVGE